MKDILLQLPPETFFILLVALLAWMGKAAIKRLDDHISQCNIRAVKNAEFTTWVTDSIKSIGDKLKADLPARPVTDIKDIYERTKY